MKTTLELPDDLIRAIKLRAVRENRKLKDLIADLLARGLAAQPSSIEARTRVQLPLVRTTGTARPDEEMTPDRVADVLLGEEADAARQ